jgi:hypothetical protein
MQLLELRRAASEHMDRMLVGMSELNLGFEQMQSTYTVDELRTLRRGDMLSPAMSAKFGAHILQLAVFLFSSHPDVTTIARGPEVRNTFIFRHAICACLLALRKISEGGAGKTAHPKLRNDLVDANFATFATFFDGLLSAAKSAPNSPAGRVLASRGVYNTGGGLVTSDSSAAPFRGGKMRRGKLVRLICERRLLRVSPRRRAVVNDIAIAFPP